MNTSGTPAAAAAWEIAGLAAVEGQGQVTSRSPARAAEGTTYEASCYTDPLGIEHLTGSLAAAIEHFGVWDARVELRATTKFAAVEPLLGLAHGGRTRLRFSVNAASVDRRFEGATATVPARLRALSAVAAAGYPVGVTIAPIMPVEGWQEQYAELLDGIAAAVPAARGGRTVQKDDRYHPSG